jgi:hypothetical protein
VGKLRSFHERLPRVAAIGWLAVFLNVPGWLLEYYALIPGFDEVAHFVTSVAMTGLAGYYCFRRLLADPETARFHASLAIFALGVALGAIWEVCEWFAFLVSNEPGIIKSINDTISDLIWDVLGAALALPLLARDLGAPLYGWRPVGVFALLTTLVWGVAENRGDDVVQLPGRERLTDEDLYRAIKARPDAFKGKTLVFRKTVSAIDDRRSFRIDADGLIGEDEIGVRLMRSELPEKVVVGDQVEIRGKVRLREGEPEIVADAVLDFAGDE